jgi:hypothetical protein
MSLRARWWKGSKKANPVLMLLRVPRKSQPGKEWVKKVPEKIRKSPGVKEKKTRDKTETRKLRSTKITFQEIPDYEKNN